MHGFEGEIEGFRATIERAYKQGLKDGAEQARQQILAAINVSSPKSQSALSAPDNRDAADTVVAEERKRAPKGLPRALATRVLKRNSNGVTPQQIAEAASTDFERMIAVSSLRSELRRGAIEGRYVEIDSLWYLASFDEAESDPSQETLSASNTSDERTEDAPSVVSDVTD